MRRQLRRLQTTGRPGHGQWQISTQMLQLFPIKMHGAIGQMDRKPRHAALVRRRRLTIGKSDAPVVQRTGDPVTEDNALRQRTTPMRATIKQCKNLVISGTKNRYRRALGALNPTGPENRDIVYLADGNPLTHSVGAIQ